MSNQELALVKADNPGTLMRQATDVAGVSRDIVMKTALTIQGRKYVRVEGWQAIAVAHGCMAGSRDVEKVEGGYRAIGEVKRMSDGMVLSTAEGFVGMDETKTWGVRPEYACRAMAQTRAISRACRSAFAHVVVLIDGNLSTTPAEEVPPGGFTEAEEVQPRPASRPQQIRPAQQPEPKPTAKSVDVLPIIATEQTRAWFVKQVDEVKLRESVTGYLVDKAKLMPNESLEEIELRHVPVTKQAYAALIKAVEDWNLGKDGLAPAQGGEDVKSEFWFGVICPIPHKGQKRDDYLKQPDTIGSLWEARHDDEESRNRLFGFANNWKPEAREYKGKVYQPSEQDHTFRAGLDDFLEWHQKNHPEEITP